MSKTTEIQIEKSRNLIEGLRRHVREMGERGVSNNEIDQMEKTVAMLSEANAEVVHLLYLGSQLLTQTIHLGIGF